MWQKYCGGIKLNDIQTKGRCAPPPSFKTIVVSADQRSTAWRRRVARHPGAPLATSRHHVDDKRSNAPARRHNLVDSLFTGVSEAEPTADPYR